MNFFNLWALRGISVGGHKNSAIAEKREDNPEILTKKKEKVNKVRPNDIASFLEQAHSHRKNVIGTFLTQFLNTFFGSFCLLLLPVFFSHIVACAWYWVGA